MGLLDFFKKTTSYEDDGSPLYSFEGHENFVVITYGDAPHSSPVRSFEMTETMTSLCEKTDEQLGLDSFEFINKEEFMTVAVLDSTIKHDSIVIDLEFMSKCLGITVRNLLKFCLHIGITVTSLAIIFTGVCISVSIIPNTHLCLALIAFNNPYTMPLLYGMYSVFFVPAYLCASIGASVMHMVENVPAMESYVSACKTPALEYK